MIETKRSKYTSISEIRQQQLLNIQGVCVKVGHLLMRLGDPVSGQTTESSSQE
jgi:hypothetical protein